MAWYNASWTYRQKITMNATLIDEVFDVLPVAGSELGADFFNNSQADGDDIRFTQADGTTELACYILDHDAGTDTGRYFVDVSAISNISTDVDIYVYYGNSGASRPATTDTYGQYNTFPSSVFAFYPLCGAHPLDNAAQNAYHLTASGSPTTSTNSPVEGVESYLFSGSSQYLYCASTPVTDWPVAISAWFNSDSVTLSQTIAAMADSGDPDDYAVLEAAGATASDPVRWRSYGDGGSERIAATSAGFTADTWLWAQGGYDSNNSTARISGANTGTNTSAPASADWTHISIAVARRSSLTNYFDGEIALVEYRSTAYSLNQAATMYNAWTNASFLSSTGEETDSSGNTGVGAITAPVATVSGAGTQTLDGTGALSAPAGAVAGTGITGRTGTGAITAPAGDVDGAGITGRTGTGAITAPAGVIAGAGVQTVSGTGALTGYIGEVDCVGTTTTSVTGTGALDSPMPSVSGAGEIESGNQDLVGALTVAAGVVQGTGITSKTGTAALVNPMPTVAASGTQTISGTGALTAPVGYTIAGTGILSPPDSVGTAALTAPVATVSGAGFVLDSAALAVDSIAWYLTGASAAGKSQRDQALSLGGFRSGVPVRSMTWDCQQPMVGVEILGVGALNGRGTGSLEAITDNSLRWTPPGGVAGTTVTLAQGQEVKLFGFESGAWILVRRNSTLPMVGIHSVQCVDIYNNVVGFDNVSSADAVAGEVFYRAIIGKNEFTGPMADIKIWLDAEANSGIAIGYESVVADEIQDIADETTAPTGITWVTGTTSATGISIASVSAGASFGLWIRRTIAADADPSPSELVHIHVQYGDLVPTTRFDDLRGKYRIARTDYETFGLWVGQDAQPDLDAAADEEFATRPHTTSLSLDPDHVYYAVVRQRNKWGLWSQNMTAKALPMDATGEQGFVAPHGPSVVAITQSGNNYPIFSARYEPSQDALLADLSRNDPGRAEIFILWYTRDDSAPDPTDTPSAYGLMGNRAGVETLKYTATGTAFLDETPVKALVRTRRLAIGAGDAFSPNTTQLPASGAGTIVVASELADWETTGYLKVTTFSGALQEVVEYSNLVIGSGISTFTVGSGGRALWGTTATATVASNVIYPITAVDSINEEVTEYTIDGIAPGRPWGELLFGTDAAQEQDPIAGPDGATEEYISVPNDHYLLLGEGWCELWMGSDLVWKVFQDGNAPSLNGLYIPSEWAIATGSISGASTGVFDSVSSTSLYVVAGSVRRAHINSSAMTITMPSFSSLGGLPEVAPQSSTWEQYAGTLLQSWDPEKQDYRPYAQLTTAGLLTSQWTVYNDLTQAEIVAL